MGLKPKPEEVQRVLDSLSEEEIKQLRKDNPFRVDRNNKIKNTVVRAIKNEPKFQTKALNIKN
jgi:hypothetical protein